MARLAAFFQASRPLAQANIATPLLYGQALAFAEHGTFRLKLAFLVHLFGILDHLFIVFANDAADWQSDIANKTYNRYSGGSRVVPEGKLTPLLLAQAAILALLAMAAVSVYLVFREGRAFMVVLTAMAAHLLWMYSFPPFRLSYRGQGEILQGLGVGVLLPVIGFYVQANTVSGLSPAALFPSFLLGYAGNLTTALPDTPSDAATGKRSFSVRIGERAARRASVGLIAIAALATPLAASRGGVWTWAASAGLALATLSKNFRAIRAADAERRDECEQFVFWNGLTIQTVLLCWTLGSALSRL